MNLAVIFAPAEIAQLSRRNLGDTTCVVFDVLRATSTMLAALHAGAIGIHPVAEIAEALVVRARQPEVLLAGEREGRRISAAVSGGPEFDLGNSPREMTLERVAGRLIVSTTTNGTKAIRACSHADKVLIAAFANLRATAHWLIGQGNQDVLLVCSGTGAEACWEDALAAGALIDELTERVSDCQLADSAILTLAAYRNARTNLISEAHRARNAQRLLAMPELADDVEWCFELDHCPLVALLGPDGVIRKW